MERPLSGPVLAVAGSDLSFVGGDVARTPGPFTVTVSVVGSAPRRPLLRAAARVEQVLAVARTHHGHLLGGERAGALLDDDPGLLLRPEGRGLDLE